MEHIQVVILEPRILTCRIFLVRDEQEQEHIRFYRRYAIVDQGKVSFSDTLRDAKGSAVPILIEKAEETHPRTQGILNEIKSKENN